MYYIHVNVMIYLNIFEHTVAILYINMHTVKQLREQFKNIGPDMLYRNVSISLE